MISALALQFADYAVLTYKPRNVHDDLLFSLTDELLRRRYF